MNSCLYGTQIYLRVPPAIKKHGRPKEVTLPQLDFLSKRSKLSIVSNQRFQSFIQLHTSEKIKGMDANVLHQCYLLNIINNNCDPV